MSALFEKGFFVRVPAWHKEGTVLDYYPGREEAMRLAGHDWDVVELRSFTEYPNEVLAKAGQPVNPDSGGRFKLDPNHVTHARSDNLFTLAKHQSSYERISNALAYEVAEILFDQGFQYDAGVSLDGGKVNALTLLLDTPVTITGDNSATLPYGCLRWAHDGSASLSANTGMIRIVCMNTWRANTAEAKKLGTEFVFRHTKNVRERIADAKDAMKGIRAQMDVYVEALEDLAAIEVTPSQRDWFVSTIIGDRDGFASSNPIASDRVKSNVESERAKVNALFLGQTIPEAHALTGYGLYLAGSEYFDHVRSYRTKDSYVKRTLLNTSSEKNALRATIAEAVAV